MDSNTFTSIQPVFWDQLDALGVLHNAHYILLIERARTEFWRSLGVKGYGEENFDWPYYVVRNEVNYRMPILGECKARVTVSIRRVGNASLTFVHEIYREDGALAAEASTVIVRTSSETQRPIPWSDGFRALVAPFVREV
jgi:acyl-CoA thioester hydrolase